MSNLKAADPAYRLTKSMRLQKPVVLKVLRAGRTLKQNNSSRERAVVIAVRALIRSVDTTTVESSDAGAPEGARFAISVPKRFLKSAVRRNQFKRLVREAFRHHEIRSLPVDMLISLASKITSSSKLPVAQTQSAIRGTLESVSEQMLTRTKA